MKSKLENVIGLGNAKRAIADNIKAWTTGKCPLLSALVLAPAGTGKTKLCLAWQAELTELGIRTMAILPSQIRKLGGAWDDLISFLSAPGPKSLFIDEAHEVFASGRTVQLAKVGSLAMVALDGNRPDSQSVKLADKLEIGWSRMECQLLLATNFPGKLPEALGGKAGRCPRLELPLYSDIEIGQIAELILASFGLRACPDSLAAFGRVARGSARVVEHLAAELRQICAIAGKTTVNKANILQAMRNRELYPLGYSPAEIEVLRYLATPSVANIVLARFPALDNPTLRSFLGYSMGQGLIARMPGGFGLTDKGRRYFRECPAMGFPLDPL